jgi:hypothetical protein
MMRNVHRGLALAAAIGIAVTGCGDDGSGGGTDSVKAMLVDELCVPIEYEVAAWAGAPITPEHNTIYAARFVVARSGEHAAGRRVLPTSCLEPRRSDGVPRSG